MTPGRLCSSLLMVTEHTLETGCPNVRIAVYMQSPIISLCTQGPGLHSDATFRVFLKAAGLWMGLLQSDREKCPSVVSPGQGQATAAVSITWAAQLQRT